MPGICTPSSVPCDKGHVAADQVYKRGQHAGPSSDQPSPEHESQETKQPVEKRQFFNKQADK
jgi:hypothetical protein